MGVQANLMNPSGSVIVCLGFVPRFCVYSLFCNIVLCVLSSLAIISLRKRELVALM